MTRQPRRVERERQRRMPTRGDGAHSTDPGNLLDAAGAICAQVPYRQRRGVNPDRAIGTLTASRGEGRLLRLAGAASRREVPQRKRPRACCAPMSFIEQVGMDRDGGGSEVLRRKPFTPTPSIGTMLPRTPSSVPLCPLLSPRDQWPPCGKHSGGLDATHGHMLAAGSTGYADYGRSRAIRWASTYTPARSAYLRAVPSMTNPNLSYRRMAGALSV